jgi:hypothetical protein
MQIPQKTVSASLDLLSRMEPAPLALYWEYQDAAESVLFVVNVDYQSESSVKSNYFRQVVPALNALIPATHDPAGWMVIFQDSTGHLITSCMGNDEYAI